MTEQKERTLHLIRERAADRRSSGQVGGVREWFEIQTLLDLLDEQLCKNCKKDVEK